MASITEYPEKSEEEKADFGVAFQPYGPENQVSPIGNQENGSGVIQLGGEREW